MKLLGYYGVLSGKYLNGAKPEKARLTISDRHNARYNHNHAQEAITQYVNIAKKYNLDPAQIAMVYKEIPDPTV